MAIDHTRDANQVIKEVFNATTGKLKVEGSLGSGVQEVLIDHTDDSIAIGDGAGSARKANVNTDNELEVHDTDTHTKLDTLNTTQGTTNTKLDDVNTELDNIKAAIDDVNTELDNIKAAVQDLTAGLVVEAHDYVEVTARDGDDNPTTILYKSGGSGGTTVATLTLSWHSSGKLTSVSKA